MTVQVLPVEPLEAYFIQNDGPGNPMTIQTSLRIEGHMDPGAAEAALAHTLVAHPLLRSMLVRGPGAKMFWQTLPESQAPGIQWMAGQTLIRDKADAFMDLTCHPGMILRIHPGEDGVWLDWLFHHACIDGIGMLELLSQFFDHYASQAGCGDPPGGRAAMDVRRLRHRSRMGLSPMAWLGRVSRIRVPVRSLTGYLGKRPCPVQSWPEPCLSNRVSKPSRAFFFELPKAAFRRLSQRAARAGVTVNSWLVSLLFQAIVAWRSAEGTLHPQDILRIMVPKNQRSGPPMPACNLVAPLFVTEEAGEIGTGPAYAARIHQKVLAEQRKGADAAFVLGLNTSRVIPGIMSQGVRSNWLPTTAILTNLGDITDRLSGTPAPIRDIRIMPPVWPNTQLVMIAYGMAGRLHLVMGYDPGALERPRAYGFFKGYCKSLESYVE